MKIYRNKFVIVFFAVLTTNAFEKFDVESRYFCATRAEFTLNPNKHRFFIYKRDEKSGKKIEILLIVRFRMIERQRRRRNIKV